MFDQLTIYGDISSIGSDPKAIGLIDQGSFWFTWWHFDRNAYTDYTTSAQADQSKSSDRSSGAYTVPTV